MTSVRVWDPFIRVFHWTLAILFTANALVTDPEKDLHSWIGYAILALLVARICWGFLGPRHARFADFPPSLTGSLRQMGEIATGRRHIHVGHSPLGALMVYNLLLTLLVIVGSGWLMTTVAYFGVEWVEELHEAAVTWAEISVAAHIAAVFAESVRLRVNLPAAMLTGRKTLPGRPGGE